MVHLEATPAATILPFLLPRHLLHVSRNGVSIIHPFTLAHQSVGKWCWSRLVWLSGFGICLISWWALSPKLFQVEPSIVNFPLDGWFLIVLLSRNSNVNFGLVVQSCDYWLFYEWFMHGIPCCRRNNKRGQKVSKTVGTTHNSHRLRLHNSDWAPIAEDTCADGSVNPKRIVNQPTRSLG